VCELVDHVEHAIFPSIVRPILDEIVRPNVITALRAQADARPVVKPKTAASGLLVRHLQSLAPPDALDPLIIDEPARVSQQRGDLAIAVAAVLASQFDDIGG
jgi:hypothetical protein